MKRPIKSIFVALLIVLLLIPSFALAEGDYERGDGWEYQNGVLMITANSGFEAYFKEVDDYNRAKKYQNEPYQVDCICIGKNVTRFSMFAFGTDFYPTQMIVEEGNTNFAVIDGWLVNLKTNTLICATNLDHFQWMSAARNMPDFVQFIGEDAFYPLNCIQQICMPDNLIGIKDNAFNSCEALNNIEIPQSVKTIGRSAFDYCTGLQKVVLGSCVDTIGEYAFYSCYNLDHINLKDTQITELNSNVLSFSGLKKIELPDSLQTIKSKAFNSCWYLETVTVCSDNIVIYDGAFSGCDELKTIIFSKGVPKWMGSRLFDETGKTADGKSYISGSIDAQGKAIPYPTILYTAAYASEWAPNGETEWKGYPIRELSMEEAKLLPVRATSQNIVRTAPCIDSGYEAGNGWVFQDGTLLVTANGGLDDFCNNEQNENFNWRYTHFPDEVEYIKIGKNVSNITPFSSYVPWYFSPKEIRIEEGNPYFICDDGWIIQKETGTLVGPTKLEDFKGPMVLNHLPDYIHAIGESAFDLECLPYWHHDPERALIKQIDFPKDLQTIGKDAFSACDELVRLNFPEKLTMIGDYAFYNCLDLEQIKFGSAVCSIGKGTFYKCSALKKTNLEGTKITDLRERVFGNCTELSSIILPETLKTIETDAFDTCLSLKTVIFYSDRVTIQSGAFKDCTSLKYMIFTKGVPAKFEESLFGELGKTPDGRYYISNYNWNRGMPIPYPTLFYTAAYADEWAPNGEKEWNGYPIEEISQDELNIILAEARGEPAPTPIATAAPTATALPATSATQSGTQNTADDTSFVGVLFAGVIVLVGVAIVVVVVRIKKSWRRKATRQPEQDCGDHARDKRNSCDRPEQ